MTSSGAIFVDWYIELVKSRLRQESSTSRRVAQQTLAHVLDGILKLLHPFMPHITEEIWQTLTQKETVLALQAYPQAEADKIDPQLEAHFELLIGTIRTIRNLRAEADIKRGVSAPVMLQSDSDSERQILKAGETYIQDLAQVEQLTITESLTEEPKEAIASVVGTVQAVIPLTGLIDIDSFRTKLAKKLSKVEGEVAGFV